MRYRASLDYGVVAYCLMDNNDDVYTVVYIVNVYMRHIMCGQPLCNCHTG